MDSIFKIFWYDSTRGMNPRSTDYEADALTTAASCRFPTLAARLLTGTEFLDQIKYPRSWNIFQKLATMLVTNKNAEIIKWTSEKMKDPK